MSLSKYTFLCLCFLLCFLKGQQHFALGGGGEQQKVILADSIKRFPPIVRGKMRTTAPAVPCRNPIKPPLTRIIKCTHVPLSLLYIAKVLSLSKILKKNSSSVFYDFACIHHLVLSAPCMYDSMMDVSDSHFLSGCTNCVYLLHKRICAIIT